MCKVGFASCTAIIDVLIYNRIHTIRLSTLRCSSRSQPFCIIIRLLQESDISNTHTCAVGTKGQRASPRPSLILYNFARLVRHCAKQSDRDCTGHLSEPSIYENQWNLRIRAFRKRCSQLSSVRCSTRDETFIQLLTNFPGQRWSHTILPYWMFFSTGYRIQRRNLLRRGSFDYTISSPQRTTKVSEQTSS